MTAERTPPPPTTLFDSLPGDLAAKILDRGSHRDQSWIDVDGDSAYAVLEAIHSAAPDVVLSDVTAVDYLDQERPERFLVVYTLQDRRTGQFSRVQAWVPEENPRIASAFPLWKLASWGERECHDMFGIVFDGNPDLRRMLMPEDYPGFPLLKDYPLKGHGERAQFPRIVPEGNEMHAKTPLDYPVTIGRGLHTPEYLAAMRDGSRPKSGNSAEQKESGGDA